MHNYFTQHSFFKTFIVIALYLIGDFFIKLKIEKSKTDRTENEPLYELLIHIIFFAIRYVKKVHLPCFFAKYIIEVFFRFLNVSKSSPGSSRGTIELKKSTKNYVKLYLGFFGAIKLLQLFKRVYFNIVFSNNHHTSHSSAQQSHCCGSQQTLKFKRRFFLRSTVIAFAFLGYLVNDSIKAYYSLKKDQFIFLYCLLRIIPSHPWTWTVVRIPSQKVSKRKWAHELEDFIDLLQYIKELIYSKIYIYAIYFYFYKSESYGFRGRNMVDFAPILGEIILREHDIKEFSELVYLVLLCFKDVSKFSLKNTSVNQFLYKLSKATLGEFIGHGFYDLLVLIKCYNFYSELGVSILYVIRLLLFTPFKEYESVTRCSSKIDYLKMLYVYVNIVVAVLSIISAEHALGPANPPFTPLIPVFI